MMVFGGVLWLVLVVAMVVLVIRYVGDRPATSSPAAADPSARELLDRRLARGEIDVEEYERRRDAMSMASRGS